MRFSDATIEDVLMRLHSVKGYSPQWTAKCPAHDDRNPSLSISTGANGKPLLYCHAGCSIEAVVSALGYESGPIHSADSERSNRKIAAEYTYTDRNGTVLFKKVRYMPKSFSIMHPDGRGGWLNGIGNAEKVLYKLPELLHAVANCRPVLIVEGEKDVATAQKYGLTATTNFDGAGKWRPEYNQYFSNADVVIIQDNDAAGKAHAQLVARNLAQVTKSIKIVDLCDGLENFPEKGDLTDFADHILSRSTNAEVSKLLNELINRTKPYTPSESVNDTIKPADYSDVGNAEIFSKWAVNKLIFSDALGWLYWTGQRWATDDHKALSLAMEFSGLMLSEAQNQYFKALHIEADAKAAAATGVDSDQRALECCRHETQEAKNYLTHAKQTRYAVKLKNMLDLSKPSLLVQADKFDAHPLDMNTPAGIVDLTTGIIRPHDQAALCSKITTTIPSTQSSEIWERFLDTITCGDASIKGFLQLVAGMAAVGTVYEEGIIIAFGDGRNGKSTFFNAISAVMGDYAGGIDVRTLTTDRQNKGASLATLRGKRLVVTGELEEHQRLSVATLKQLASTDNIIIEEKFKAPESIRPSHTLCLFTNHMPRVGSTDTGTWRRLLVVPFKATIPSGSICIQNYANMLVEEAGGAILQWIIDGAVLFHLNKYKLTIPDVVAEVTEEYQQRENWLANFIAEKCILDPNARVGAAELYEEYRNWSEQTGDFTRRLNDFTAAMEAAGFQKIAPKNRKTWIGLRLDRSQYYENFRA